MILALFFLLLFTSEKLIYAGRQQRGATMYKIKETNKSFTQTSSTI
jgi:hypothetical protein